MGWYYTNGSTKKQLIEELTRDEGNHKCLKKCVRGDVLWTVREYVTETGETKRFIGCDLLGKHGGEGWGHKPLDESMGPSDVSCPLSYLDMVPMPDSKYAAGWRDRVREYHAATRPGARPKLGETILLPPGYPIRELTVTSVKPLRASDGCRTYRINNKVLRAAWAHQRTLFEQALSAEKK